MAGKIFGSENHPPVIVMQQHNGFFYMELVFQELLPPHLQTKANEDTEDLEAAQRAASTDVSSN